MIELEVSKIQPNEFKKEINGGKLNEEQVKRLMSNIEELGLMGALPVYEKDGEYHLVNGHHRLEALKRAYGKDTKIPVVVHKYSEENVLRGMIVENLTQRNNDFKETLDNLIVIRQWLKKELRPTSGRNSAGRPEEAGSVREISGWLNKQGEVLSKSSIADYLSISDDLDPELKKQIVKKEGSELTEGIAVKDAKVLAKFSDKQEQKQLAVALHNTRERNQRNRLNNVSIYKTAPEEVKAKVRRGEVDLADVKGEVFKTKIKEIRKNKITVIDAKKLLAALTSESSQVDKAIDRYSFLLRGYKKRGVFGGLKQDDTKRIIQSNIKTAEEFAKLLQEIAEGI